MFRNWTFGRKVGGGFAVTVVAIVVIATTGYRSTRSLIANDARVAHSHQVRRQLSELLVELVNAETGQRGFVITAEDEFLEPYTAALSSIDKAYAEVRQLTIDSPAHTARLGAMRPLIDAKLAELGRRIELRRSSTFEAAAASIKSGEGKRLMDKIRSIIGEMDRDETSLLDSRRRDAEASTEAANLVVIVGSIAAIMFTVIVGWLITSRLSRQIGSAVQHVQSSSTELQAAATQQASGAREQAVAMTEISTTIKELLVTSRQIADGAQRVSQIAERTAATAHTGELTVVRARAATSTVRQQVDLAVRHMSDLVGKSQQIEAVVAIIAELAEQTNILAINATIEAAGAGDTGLRFAVVADEIRKLADRVRASTKDIGGMVDDVRTAVATTVMSTEAGSKAVDVGATHVLEMAAAFQQISDLVGTTTEAAKEIALSTKQQTTAVEQVNVAITSAAGATRETEASASQTLQTASQLTALSASLVSIVHVEARASYVHT